MFVLLIKDKIYTELSLVELSIGYRLFRQIDVFVGGRFFKSEIEYRDDPDDPNNIIKGEKNLFNDDNSLEERFIYCQNVITY